MRKYLANLHEKPDHHKKQFAFLASGTITLFIFGVWSLATFGIDRGTVAESGNVPTVANREVSPFQSLRMNLGASIEALKSNLSGLNSELKSVDFEAEYNEMRDGAINIYGE